MNREDICRILNDSIEELFENDSYLLSHDVHERTICAHLANYLEKRVKEFDSELSVDCEYNRNGPDPKMLPVVSDDEKRAFPDIIVHKRGTNDSNIIVIEVKKGNSRARIDDFDKLKLGLFTSEQGEYHFEMGFFIKIGYGRRERQPFFMYTVFVNGQPEEHT